jgi:orotidine-5'-phosphate decarboxylase
MYNMDRLYEAVAARGHVCVGLDTSPDYVPAQARGASAAESVLAFNRAVIDATADITTCFKVQIAYYEAMGREGLETYAKTLSCIRQRNSLVIADIKRGDIADTAIQYAKAHFEGDFEADFVTLSPYMGMDSIEPWLSYAVSGGKGAFVLLRTSNRGMRDFQNVEIKGKTAEHPERLYHAVGDRLAALAALHQGKYGYGAFGAVVGADPKSGTEREEAAALRERYGSLFFLIPGYGTQGGAAEDAALLLREGNGGVVNASRSILRAWTEKASLPFFEAAREAAITMRDAIWEAIQRK